MYFAWQYFAHKVRRGGWPVNQGFAWSRSPWLALARAVPPRNSAADATPPDGGAATGERTSSPPWPQPGASRRLRGRAEARARPDQRASGPQGASLITIDGMVPGASWPCSTPRDSVARARLGLTTIKALRVGVDTMNPNPAASARDQRGARHAARVRRPVRRRCRAHAALLPVVVHTDPSGLMEWIMSSVAD